MSKLNSGPPAFNGLTHADYSFASPFCLNYVRSRAHIYKMASGMDHRLTDHPHHPIVIPAKLDLPPKIGSYGEVQFENYFVTSDRLVLDDLSVHGRGRIMAAIHACHTIRPVYG